MGRTFFPTRAPMLTGATDLDLGVSLAHVEDIADRLVSVCCRCISPRLREALRPLGNLSHGLCEPCAAAELAQLERMVAA